MNIAQALQNLRPGASWEVNGDTYSGIVWREGNTTDIPTEQEIVNEIARLKQVNLNTQYKRDRMHEYPAIADQLDMLWHAMDTGALTKVDAFYDAIKAVKDANPKP
jgi:hypothetical protein